MSSTLKYEDIRGSIAKHLTDNITLISSLPKIQYHGEPIDTSVAEFVFLYVSMFQRPPQRKNSNDWRRGIIQCRIFAKIDATTTNLIRAEQIADDIQNNVFDQNEIVIADHSDGAARKGQLRVLEGRLIDDTDDLNEGAGNRSDTKNLILEFPCLAQADD